MDISIKSPHMDITPALKETIEDKLSRFEKHTKEVIKANVVLSSLPHNQFKAEIVVRTGAQSFVASSEGPDMYASINKASQLIDRQWRKKKTAELSARQNAPSIRKMI